MGSGPAQPTAQSLPDPPPGCRGDRRTEHCTPGSAAGFLVSRGSQMNRARSGTGPRWPSRPP